MLRLKILEVLVLALSAASAAPAAISVAVVPEESVKIFEQRNLEHHNMNMDDHPENSSTSSEDGLSKNETSSGLVAVPHKPKHQHGMSILHMDLAPEERLFWENYSTETFFTTPSKHRVALYVHIASYLGSYIFLFPLVLVFWNISHGLYFPALTLHTALIMLSTINYWVFTSSVRPDLYVHSAFSTMTVLLFVGSIVHWVVSALAVAYRALTSENNLGYGELDSEEENLSMLSPTLTLRESNSRFDSFELDDFGHHSHGHSDSNGNGNGMGISISNSNSNSPDGHLLTSNEAMHQKTSKTTLFLHSHPFLEKMTHAFGKSALRFTSILNWTVFGYFLVYFPTGIATYLLYGQDQFKFNLLAHFIKGGVFFVLGLVTLARYCGAFKNKGWAWNHRFVTIHKASTGWLKWQSKGLWTMEMVESALILFYGSTNIFMEHLGNTGGKWSPKDLQHASIAFIYIGCGLCGVLLEKMLASWRYEKAIQNASSFIDNKVLATVTKATPGFSPNPFPLLTIYWTGVLMSSHEQASSLSSEIHKQWGNLFVMACAFRVLSYFYFLLKGAEGRALTKPLYPITELFVSFALLCGGAIFMQSCDSVVNSLEYYGLTSMFTLNICLGLVTLLMAWVMSVFFMKDAWISRKSTH